MDVVTLSNNIILNGITKLFSKALSFKARQNIYVVLQVLSIFLLTKSFVDLRNPEIMPIFAGFGSFFIFIVFTRKRKQYDDAVTACNNNIFALRLKYDRDRDKFKELSLETTFNHHAVAIRRLAQACKVKTNFPVASDAEVDELEVEVYRQLDCNDEFMKDQEILSSKFKLDLAELQQARAENSSWAHWLEQLEGIFIFYFAVVAALGAQFVKWLYSA